MSIVHALLLLLFLGSAASAQVSRADIFDEESEIAWLGLDFTKARLVGLDMTGEEAKEKFIPRWNGVIGMEWNKFDIEAHFGYEDVSLDFERTLDRNHQIDEDGLMKMTSGPADKLERSDIEELAAAYEGYSDRPIGLIFVVEQFNKYAEEEFGAIWVSFIDLDNGKLLFTERMEGSPGGMGKVSYWSSTAHRVIKRGEEHLDEWEDR